MKEVNKDKVNNLGGHFDVKIGREYRINRPQMPDKSFEEEMIKMMKLQTAYMRQIKCILYYFFCLSIVLMYFIFIY